MDVKLLREATRPEHEATEAAVPLAQADLTREGYVAVLQRFHRVVCAWDAVAAAEAPMDLIDLVRQRSRCSSLSADLQFFQAPVAAAEPELLLQEIRALIQNPEGNGNQVSTSRFLGAMYVLEGSTLGGQYIAHAVEGSLKLIPGEGDRFFRGYGKETMPKWREFQQVLREVPDEDSPAVIDAAKGMFGIFQKWMGSDGAATGLLDVSAEQKVPETADETP